MLSKIYKYVNICKTTFFFFAHSFTGRVIKTNTNGVDEEQHMIMSGALIFTLYLVVDN